MGGNSNSPDSQSVGSISSSFSALPRTLDPNMDGPSSSPPTAAGSNQELPDPNLPDFRSDQVPRQEGEANMDGPSSSPPTAAGSNQELPDPNSPDFRSDQVPRQEGEEEKEEEEAECAFCVFMKGGGCKDQFIAWENCVEEAEKNKEDMVVKCFEVTSLLKKCMEAHPDYYEPILRAEEEMSDSVSEEALSDSVPNEAGKESVEVEETIIEAVSEEVAEARDSKVGD